MFLSFLFLIFMSLSSVHPSGRAVISTGSKDIVSMWQMEPHEKTFPHLDDIRRQIYDTLYEIDETGSARESLAQGCDVLDYKEDIENNVRIVLNCRMRLAVYFHDGIELSSRDVEFSINRLKASKTLSSYYDIVESCTTPDKYNVRFVLKYRTPEVGSSKEWLLERFKRVLATTGYIVRARYFEGNTSWAVEYPVGTGPFYFVDWKMWNASEGRSQIILAKNRSYWKKEYPKLDQLIFRFLPANMWAEQMKQGFLSAVIRPTARDHDNFGKENKDEGFAAVSKRLRFSYQYMLFSPYSKYFRSKDLKRAFLNSVSREMLAKSMGSTAMINYGRSLYASTIFPQKYPVLKYKPREAREALLEYLKSRKSVARLDNSRGYITLNILVPDRIEELLVAEELKRQLYPIGFSLKVTKLSSEKYNIAVNNEAFNNYDIILYSVDENPNYITPSVREILSYGGVQLYQRSLVYMLARPNTESSVEPFSTPLTKFAPPAEGPVFLFDAE
jgi:ABC-type transport system substrate-binding protein